MKKQITTFALASVLMTSNAINTFALENGSSSKTKDAIKKVKEEKNALISENKKINEEINSNQLMIENTKCDLEKVLSQKAENEKELNKTELELKKEVVNLKNQISNYYMSSYSSNISVLKELVGSGSTSDFIITSSHLKYIVDDREKKVDVVSELLEKYKKISKKISDNESKLISLQSQLKNKQNTLENILKENSKQLEYLSTKQSELEDILIIQEKEELAIKQAILNASKVESVKDQSSDSVQQVDEDVKKPAQQTTEVVSSDKVSSTELQRPVTSYRLTSKFGMRTHPITGDRKLHGGVDLAAPKGTPIMSSQSGTVVISQYSSSYGHYVVVDHGDGLSTLYAHLSERLASVGDKVSVGQVIGKMGSTGMSTGSHLHFEVRVNGEKINPQLKVSL